VGDVVRIIECRPLSRTKHFEVLEAEPAGASTAAAAATSVAAASATAEAGGAEP